MKIFRIFLKVLLMLTIFCCSKIFVGADFHIVEVMPSTTNDTKLEYITIQNTAPGAMSLSGYILSDKKKDFIFSSEILLQAGEKRQFFRPETKLILNNSNEKLTLKNQRGTIVSEVKYARSTKGEALYFEIAEVEEEEYISSDEVLISQEAIISDEVSIGNASADDFFVPEVIFHLQRPSYISQSGSTAMYVCDFQKQECKVNFDLRPSFSSDFLARNYRCKISFGSGTITGQEGRCNPNTVVFPEGISEVKFQIFHKDDENIVSEKVIYIHNIPPALSLNGGPEISGSKQRLSPKIALFPPKIVVQSGLEGSGRYFRCKKSDCRINLKYKKWHTNERCFWDFGPGIYTSLSTRERCNPGYVRLPEGTHELKLRVYEKNNETNRKILRFYVYNEPEEIHEKEKGTLQDESEKQETKAAGEEVQEAIHAAIVLQGKQTHTQTRGPVGVLCLGVEKCYLNFTALGFTDSQKYDYTWLDNGEVFSQKYNPRGKWFKGGKHMIHFQVFQDGNMLSQASYNALVRHTTSFPAWGKVSKKKKMKKKKQTFRKEFTQNFLPLKYDGLRISGKAPIGSMVEVYAGEIMIGKVKTNAKGKYRIVSKNIGAGSYIFATKIINAEGKVRIYEHSGEYELLPEKRAYWFVSKKSGRRSSKKSKTLASPKLVLQSYAHSTAVNSPPLSLGQKILSFIILSCAILLACLHMFFRQMQAFGHTSFLLCYTMRFATKQRVNLLLG